MNPSSKNSLFFLFSSILFIYSASPVRSDTDLPARTEWRLDESYTGPHRTEFDQLRWKIPHLVRQTSLNAAVRLGLNFEDGWRYPLTIGFVDGSPPGVENALAYVRLYTDGKNIGQQLHINLDLYARQGFDFEKVFAHELIHAMVNDGIGAEAGLLLPLWFHEGIAVFGSEQGETLVKTYAHRDFGFAEEKMINGLEGPHGALDYAEDYLAFKFLWKTAGSNAFHNFVKEVIRRQGDLPGALQYTCFMSWDEFQTRAKVFAKEEIQSLGPARRGATQKPF